MHCGEMLRLLGFSLTLSVNSIACSGNDDSDTLGGTSGTSGTNGTGGSPTGSQTGDSGVGSGTPSEGGSSTSGTSDESTSQGETAEQGECDPSGCKDYCVWARCLFGAFGEDECLEVCTTQCGNMFFDEEDQALLSCQSKVTNDLSCTETQACCDEFFVNEICP